jgi:hypothetical protein
MNGGFLLFLLFLLSFGHPGADTVPGELLAAQPPLAGKPEEPAAGAAR